MSKGLSSMSRSERALAIARRLKNKTGGLGYIAAVESRTAVNVVRGQLAEQRKEHANTVRSNL